MRRQFLINRDFQYRFMIFVCGIALVGITIQILTILYFVNEILSIKAASEQIITPKLYYFLNQNSDRYLGIFLCSALFFFFFSLFASLIFSHKIAGPLYRLTLFLKQPPVDNENYQKLSFRKEDFFQDIPEKVNNFTETLINNAKER